MLIPYTGASPTLQSCYMMIGFLKRSNFRRQNLLVSSCSMNNFTELTKDVAQRKYHMWSVFPSPLSLPSPKPSSVQIHEFLIRLRTVAFNAFDVYFPSLDHPTSPLLLNSSSNEITFKDVINQFKLSFQELIQCFEKLIQLFQQLREFVPNIFDACSPSVSLGMKIGILGMLVFVFMYRKRV